MENHEEVILENCATCDAPIAEHHALYRLGLPFCNPQCVGRRHQAAGGAWAGG